MESKQKGKNNIKIKAKNKINCKKCLPHGDSHDLGIHFSGSHSYPKVS